MPDLVWTIIPSIVSLAAGFILGLLLSSKNRRKGIYLLRKNFGIIPQKLEVIEREFSVNKNPITSKAPFSDKTPFADLKNDISVAADRLDNIIRHLKISPRFNKPNITKDEKPEITISRSADEPEDEPKNNFINNALSPESEITDLSFQISDPFPNSPQQEITELYNQASENRDARDLFREKYTITRIGNNKAVEQRLGEASEPIKGVNKF